MNFGKICAVCLVLLASIAYALSISNVLATNITNSSATINWTTDAASDSYVNYWVTGSPEINYIYDNATVNSHAIELTQLSQNTTYNYNVSSCTPNFANCTGSLTYAFTTLANPSPTPSPTPTPTPTITPTPTPVPCAPSGGFCTANSQCCSNKCNLSRKKCR